MENPSANIVTIPIEECTPLATIPENVSFTYRELGLDEVVVVVWDYYYNHKTKAIKRRIRKRKMGESMIKHKSFERRIKWMTDKDPNENDI
jgi:hypothetical protein